jgi:hypothetical protein
VFLSLLDPFITSWDAAFPDKACFLKLHHLLAHSFTFVNMYHMYGIASAEGFEALHPKINALMQLSSSQTAEKRVADKC